MPTAYVTGGTGFVGRHLVEQLRAEDWRVLALHRASSDVSALEAVGVELIEGVLHEGDLGIPNACDAVFHVAADTSIWRPHAARQHLTNVDGTENVVRQALDAKCGRLVHVSSVSAWGRFDRRIDETVPMRGGESPVPYKRTKFLAEQRVHAAIEDGLDAVIVNPCHIIGPYDRGTWARILSMVHARNLPGVPDGVGVFCDVREVARAMRRAASVGTRGENYLLGGERSSFLNFVQTAGRVLDRPVPGRATPSVLLRAVAHAKDAWSRVSGVEPDLTPDGLTHVLVDLDVDDTKAQRVLDYTHTPLAELIEETAAWMREAGRLSG